MHFLRLIDANHRPRFVNLTQVVQAYWFTVRAQDGQPKDGLPKERFCLDFAGRESDDGSLVLTDPEQIELVCERLALLAALVVFPCDGCEGHGVIAESEDGEPPRPARCPDCGGTGKAVW